MSDTKQAFTREWSAFYADRRPVGWMLRQDKSLPWVRFHSLPNSKRYPEDSHDQDILLRRARILGDAILGRGTDCWQVECRLGELDPPRWNIPAKGVVSSTFTDADDESLWVAHVLPVTWRQGAPDGKLLAIFDDQTGPMLWFNRETGRIFAPYDGGFDLFPSSANEVERLKSDYKDWLSLHSAGL